MSERHLREGRGEAAVELRRDGLGGLYWLAAECAKMREQQRSRFSRQRRSLPRWKND